MRDDGIWSRLKKGRLVQVLGVYLAASWVVLQVVGELRDSLELPAWIGPFTFILLGVGLLVVLATAWVQSHPLVEAKEAADEVPRSWELDVAEIKSSLKKGEVPHLNWARALLGGVFAFSLLFGFAGLYIVIQDQGRSFEPSEALADAAPAIAVMPFTVRGEGLDVWREGMVEALSANLDGAADLRAIDPRTVLARWRERVDESGSADLAAVMGVARATGARWALIGSIIQSGTGVRLSADIHEVDSGAILGDGRSEGSPDSIFALVDELSIEVLRSLFADEGAEFSFNLARLTTHSVPALHSYLEGEGRFRRGEFDAAVPLYRRAIEQDSTFGLAYYRLSEAYGWTTSYRSEAGGEALARALELVDRLPEREALLLRARAAVNRSEGSMIDSLAAAVRRYPDDAEAWYLLGDTYLHAGETHPANLEEIADAFDRAVALDPGFTPYVVHWLDLGMWWRPDSATAAARLERLEEIAPDAEHLVLEAQIEFDLSFGDSATRATRIAALPDVEWELRARLSRNGLYHARFAPQREALLRSLLADAPPGERAQTLMLLSRTVSQGMGQFERGSALLDDPAIPPVPRACRLWDLYRFELPVDRGRLQGLLTGFPSDSTAPFCVQLARLTLAADEGRWADQAETRAWFDATIARIEGQMRDSAQLADFRVASRAILRSLDGYAEWRRGDSDTAVPMLEAGAEESGFEWIRWWLARAAMDAGRWAEAERWLRSFHWTELPLAHYHLGKVYEELGNRDRAIAAYRYFAEAWYEADAELQPRVEEARQALARLMDAPAGTR